MVCVTCEGTGVVVKPRSQVDVTCPSCGGIGNVPDWPVSASEAEHDLGNRIAQALFAAQPFTFSLMIFEGGRAFRVPRARRSRRHSEVCHSARRVGLRSSRPNSSAWGDIGGNRCDAPFGCGSLPVAAVAPLATRFILIECHSGTSCTVAAISTTTNAIKRITSGISSSGISSSS
jgi:hypothetical protein